MKLLGPLPTLFWHLVAQGPVGPGWVGSSALPSAPFVAGQQWAETGQGSGERLSGQGQEYLEILGSLCRLAGPRVYERCGGCHWSGPWLVWVKQEQQGQEEEASWPHRPEAAGQHCPRTYCQEGVRQVRATRPMSAPRPWIWGH